MTEHEKRLRRFITKTLARIVNDELDWRFNTLAKTPDKLWAVTIEGVLKANYRCAAARETMWKRSLACLNSVGLPTEEMDLSRTMTFQQLVDAIMAYLDEGMTPAASVPLDVSAEPEKV